MTETVFQLRVNQTVSTPHGRAVIQGRMVDREGRTQILVSHDPKNPNLPEEIMKTYKGGIWVLWSYPVEEIKPIQPTSRSGCPPQPGRSNPPAPASAGGDYR